MPKLPTGWRRACRLRGEYRIKQVRLNVDRALQGSGLSRRSIKLHNAEDGGDNDIDVFARSVRLLNSPFLLQRSSLARSALLQTRSVFANGSEGGAAHDETFVFDF